MMGAAITAARLLLEVIDRAKHALDASEAEVKSALAELEKEQAKLAADRKDTDTALDKKFEGK